MGGKKMQEGSESEHSGEEEEMEENEPSYEEERKAILEENRKRMMELGLLDAASFIPAPKMPKKHTPKPIPEGPLRRSSRVRAAPELYKPLPITVSSRRVISKGPARSPREEYTGPRRRSSRLSGTRVSYIIQLQSDSETEDVVEMTKEEAEPVKPEGGLPSSEESEEIPSSPAEVVPSFPAEVIPSFPAEVTEL